MTTISTLPYELWQRTLTDRRPLRWGPYARVYTGRVDNTSTLSLATHTQRQTATLDILFRTFNIEHPADFTGHSLSVGDIVVLDDIAYACQSRGWARTAHPNDHPLGVDTYFTDVEVDA